MIEQELEFDEARCADPATFCEEAPPKNASTARGEAQKSK
jgi:hypothetical protein